MLGASANFNLKNDVALAADTNMHIGSKRMTLLGVYTYAAFIDSFVYLICKLSHG